MRMTNEKRQVGVVIAVVHSTKKITDELEKIVANLEDLNNAADSLVQDVREAVDAINSLKEQVANGDGISQEQLDAIASKLDAAGDALDEAREGTDPQVNPL
jgi:hypothetical protein